MKYFNKFAGLYGKANEFAAKNNLAIKTNQTNLTEFVRHQLVQIPDTQINDACAEWFSNTVIRAGLTVRDAMVEVATAHIVDDIITSKRLPNVATVIEEGESKYAYSHARTNQAKVVFERSEEENEIMIKQGDEFAKATDNFVPSKDDSDCGTSCTI
jgi:hypothetical protein